MVKPIELNFLEEISPQVGDGFYQPLDGKLKKPVHSEPFCRVREIFVIKLYYHILRIYSPVVMVVNTNRKEEGTNLVGYNNKNYYI